MSRHSLINGVNFLSPRWPKYIHHQDHRYMKFKFSFETDNDLHYLELPHGKSKVATLHEHILNLRIRGSVQMRTRSKSTKKLRLQEILLEPALLSQESEKNQPRKSLLTCKAGTSCIRRRHEQTSARHSLIEPLIVPTKNYSWYILSTATFLS